MMAKITMTQWWELLEKNLSSLSSKLDPENRAKLTTSEPWKAAMEMATQGKVIEEKGFFFAMRQGSKVEADMKKLAEGLGPESLPNVNDPLSLLFALSYADYMPFYTSIESSVPIITNFMQTKDKIDLIQLRTNKVRERILAYYEANKDKVLSIPGIRQMPGVGILNLPPEQRITPEVNRSRLELLEEKLNELAKRISETKQQIDNTRENTRLLDDLIAALKEDSTKDINRILEAHPQAVKLINERLNADTKSTVEKETLAAIKKSITNLKPGYLPRSLWDALPRFVAGPTIEQTRTTLIKDLNSFALHQKRILREDEESLLLATSDQKSTQDELQLLENEWVATYLKSNFYTLSGEKPNLGEMTTVSARLGQLTAGLNALIAIKDLESKGKAIPHDLTNTAQTNLTADTQKAIKYLSKKSKTELQHFKSDAMLGKKVVDQYCATMNQAQALRDSQIQPTLIQRLADAYTWVKRLLEILPDWISGFSLRMMGRREENNKKIRELEDSLDSTMGEIRAMLNPQKGGSDEPTPGPTKGLGQPRPGFFKIDDATDKGADKGTPETEHLDERQQP